MKSYPLILLTPGDQGGQNHHPPHFPPSDGDWQPVSEVQTCDTDPHPGLHPVWGRTSKEPSCVMFAVLSITAACLLVPLTSAFQHCCFQLLRLAVTEKLTISTSINSTETFYWVWKWIRFRSHGSPTPTNPTVATSIWVLNKVNAAEVVKPRFLAVKWPVWRRPLPFPPFLTAEQVWVQLCDASKHLSPQPRLWRQTQTHKQSCCVVHMHIRNLALLFSPYLSTSAYFRCPIGKAGLSHHRLPRATVSQLVNLRTHQRVFEKRVMAPFAALCKLLKKLC